MALSNAITTMDKDETEVRANATSDATIPEDTQAITTKIEEEAQDVDLSLPPAQAKVTDERKMRNELSQRRHRRREIFTDLLRALTTELEDQYDDTSLGSDESVEPSDTSDGLRSPRSTVFDGPGASEPTMFDRLGQTDTETKELLLHRAEFYKYRNLRGSYDSPKLVKSINTAAPVTVETDLSKSRKRLNDAPFIFTTMYAVADDDGFDLPSSKAKVRGKLETYLTVNSVAILEALRSVIKFYPTAPSLHESLDLYAPYCMILHHISELEEYQRSNDQAKGETTNPESEDLKDPSKHLSLLMNALKQSLGPELEVEEIRNRQGLCTFQLAWHLFKPGNVVYMWENGNLAAFIVSHHSTRESKQISRATEYGVEDWTYAREQFGPPEQLGSSLRSNGTNALYVTVFRPQSDGQKLGRVSKGVLIEPFDGEKSIKDLRIFPENFLVYDKTIHKELSVKQVLIERGKKYCKLLKGAYMGYTDNVLNSWQTGSAMSRQQAISRVVVDEPWYFDQEARLGERRTLPPEIGLEEDTAAKSPDDEYFAAWPTIPIVETDRLTDEQYRVCHYVVRSFVLRDRAWKDLEVSALSELKFFDRLIDDLVLKPEAKSLILALSKRYASPDTQETATRSADFVANKGEGQIFLLHGRPGVGKTSTVECVAEMTGRPLLALTCGDLGLDPLKVESSLQHWMKLAAHWGAILLIDEADVYLESRVTSDLQRNSLVSIFLRAIEYYPGLLFLTTNRVGQFDEGFISRIHIILHYADFSDDQRAQIWDNLFDKLEREQENFRVMQRTMDFAKTSEQLMELKWNGREIRNAFNTAVALAEYQNQRDDKGRIMILPKHLEDVMKMSSSFRQYLKSTIGMDQSKKAKLHRVRDDDAQE